MIKFDHIAITVDNLDKSISFYEKLGYKVKDRFNDEEYNWATLELNSIGLELFQLLKKDLPKISHIAYNFTDDKEAFDIANKAGYKIDDSDVFYGDLNRKSFFIEDNNGTSIQLIKKKL